jgi:hypothetical protein
MVGTYLVDFFLNMGFQVVSQHDNLPINVSSDENGPEFSGPISLYDRLNVEAA